MDAFGDQGSIDREPYEYPFGRVRTDFKPQATRVQLVLQPETWQQTREYSDWRGHENQHASRATSTSSSYPTAFAPGYNNIVPDPRATRPAPSKFDRRSVRNHALSQPSYGGVGCQQNALMYGKKKEPNSNTFVAGVTVAAVAFALDLPGTISRVTREHKAHAAVSSCFALETVNPETAGGGPFGFQSLLVDSRATNIMGHFASREAPRRALSAVKGSGVDGRKVMLHKSASKSFNKMQRDALRDGVALVPISGFRDVEKQSKLFFDVANERGQSHLERAKVSAPPGYSEHHTGYAIDVSSPEVDHDLTESFENTESFKWLEKNAKYYNFEMSFCKNNATGVAFEPWHWRWVGDATAKETFAVARQGTEGLGFRGVSQGRCCVTEMH
ncbi:D-alanyl-D-alanine carboxypeptidase family protein [bacterium]|nr:D-alanyl-D-alanine carboxypeptidase family protein [bacterium]